MASSEGQKNDLVGFKTMVKFPVTWKASSSQMIRFSNLFGIITPTYFPFIG